MSGASEFGTDHGLIHEAVITGRKAGWGSHEWARLAHDQQLMEQLREVFYERASIERAEHIIDCSADASDFQHCVVLDHIRTDLWAWNPKRISFYTSGAQRSPGYIRGHELWKELAGKPVLNANVLDYLLKNPRIIPEAWKRADTYGRRKYVTFWGTIYRDSACQHLVRRLFWWTDAWHSEFRSLSSHFAFNEPAVLRSGSS